ncbi:mate-domain-containing protein [Martensiomyces pterosporus]|nr:mate-domain-containing protein [Martensiomyces pterosporus]
MRRPSLHIQVSQDNGKGHHQSPSSGPLSTCSYPSPLLTPTPTPAHVRSGNPFDGAYSHAASSDTRPPHTSSTQAVTPPLRKRISPTQHLQSHHHNAGDYHLRGAPPPAFDVSRSRTEPPPYLRSQSAIVGGRRTPTSQHSGYVPFFPSSSSSSLLMAGMHSPTHPPTHSQSRPRSRRPSIVLQSSYSYSIPMSLPQSTLQQPMSATLQQQRVPLLAMDPRYLASTKSLPNGDAAITTAAPSALTQAEQAAAARSYAQRSRRRSIAHERYPPLVSIFEAGSSSEAGGLRHETAVSERQSAGNGTGVPPLAAPAQAPPSVAPLPPPSAMPAAQADEAAAMGLGSIIHCCYQGEEGGVFLSASEDPQPAAVPHTHGVLLSTTEQGCSGDDCPLTKRSDSRSSLLSVFSTASSSSSSSTQSTYAYIFDSARPSTLATPETHHHRGRAQTPSAYCTPLYTGANRHSAGDILFGTSSLFFNTMASRAPPIGFGGSAAVPDERTLLVAGDRSSSSNHTSAFARDESAARGGTYASIATDDYLPKPQLWMRELKCILWTMGPLLLGNMLQATISMSQVASSGHLGRDELAAIGLAHMVVILTGYPVAFSVLSCLETCASQAFTSAQPLLVGGYFVRAVQIQWLCGLVLGSLWFSSGPILARILHDASHATISAAIDYLRWYFIPFMVFSNLLCAKQVLYAQGITYPMPYLTLLGTVVTLGAQYLLVFAPYFQLGVRGIALGSGLSYLAMLLGTLWVIRRHDVQRVWGGLGFRAPWLPFLKLLPPCLMLALFSTGTSEFITMAATQLGTGSLTIQAVISALNRMFMITSSSSGVASLNRAGNLIGERAARGAKVTAYVSLCLGFAFAVLCGGALFVWPDFWIRIFTSDPAVRSEAVKLMPIAVLAFASQAVAFVGSQLLSAQGRQALAVRIKLVALYAIGLPLGYYWTMEKGYGLWGLWAAVAVGQLCTAAIETFVVLRTDWPLLIDKCTDAIVRGIV